jgi:chemotaxis signal transduction protein
MTTASVITPTPVREVREVSGLECLIGKARIAVPVEAVAQIIEYDVASPLPLARHLVGGLGVHDDKIVVSILLSSRGGERFERRRRAKGVLLRTPETSFASFALEVIEVGTFVELSLHDEKSQRPGKEPLPFWVRLGETGEGRQVGFIDVPSLVQELCAFDGSRTR